MAVRKRSVTVNCEAIQWESSFLSASLRCRYAKLCLPPPRQMVCNPSCLSIFHQHEFYRILCTEYCKRNQAISLKLDVMIVPTNRKKWLTFGGDPVADTDYGPLFCYHHHCGIWILEEFLVSHYIRFSQHSIDADKIMNPQHLGSDPAVCIHQNPNPD